MSKRKIKFRIVVLVCAVAIVFLAAVWMKPIDVYIQPTKTEWNEVTALRTLSSSLKINFFSNKFRIHYISSFSTDTVMEYSRWSNIVSPYGRLKGPNPSDPCHEYFYFTQVTPDEIHKAAAKYSNFKNLGGKDGWKRHEYYPLC